MIFSIHKLVSIQNNLHKKSLKKLTELIHTELL
jgi:hypothetical protein